MLGWALLLAINPVLLGLVILLISRPRPLQNLVVFWVGCMTVNVPVLLAPLIVLHLTPSFASFARDLATPSTLAGSSVAYIQAGAGVVMLSIAAVMTRRLFARQTAGVSTRRGDSSVMVLDSDPPNPFARRQSRGRHAMPESESAIRRLLNHARNTWEGEALWVAFVLGMGWFPGPYLVLLVDTTIAASGAAIAMQVSLAIAFVLTMLAVVEITLVSHVAMPAKTQAVLRRLHDWARDRRQQVLIAVFAVVGLWQVAKGTGIV